MFGEIDHIGVAVEDLDAAIELYNSKFEMAIQYRETVEEQGVEAVLLEVGGGHVELLRPLGPDTPVGKFIENRGVGMHHVAYRVDDVAAELDRLKAEGVELIDETPRIGIRGSSVAFLHPAATGGVLVELVKPVDH
ncbi:MAG: methylmalonyl-CoA epimerase [Solirubrobacterales bacterium]